MQDGDPAHCTTEAMGFLVEKFRGRVLSCETDIEQSVHSPDLNPLDFYFWALTQMRVYTTKPSTIAEVIDTNKQFAYESSEDVLKDVALVEGQVLPGGKWQLFAVSQEKNTPKDKWVKNELKCKKKTLLMNNLLYHLLFSLESLRGSFKTTKFLERTAICLSDCTLPYSVHKLIVTYFSAGTLNFICPCV